MSVRKETSITSKIGAAIWPKLTSVLLATTALKVARFRAYASFPKLMQFF
jgi:hypothetical protein